MSWEKEFINKQIVDQYGKPFQKKTDALLKDFDRALQKFNKNLPKQQKIQNIKGGFPKGKLPGGLPKGQIPLGGLPKGIQGRVPPWTPPVTPYPPSQVNLPPGNVPGTRAVVPPVGGIHPAIVALLAGKFGWDVGKWANEKWGLSDLLSEKLYNLINPEDLSNAVDPPGWSGNKYYGGESEYIDPEGVSEYEPTEDDVLLDALREQLEGAAQPEEQKTINYPLHFSKRAPKWN